MIFTGPHPDTPIPDVSLTAYVLQQAERNADKPASVDLAGGTRYTYGELAEAIRKAAGGLQVRGFGKGDTLAMLAPNVPEYPIAFHAGVLAGGTVLLLNPLDTVEDLAGHLNEARARFLVISPSEAEKAMELQERTGVELVISFGPADGAEPFFALLLTGEGAPPAIEPREDVAVLLHSSGSTGFPKGVMLTHRNMIANVYQTSVIAPLTSEDKVLAVAPFHHAFGVIMTLNASLLQGAEIVTMPRFDPEAYLRAIQEHKITRLYVVPTIAVLLARSPMVDQYDLSSVRSIVSGGAALDPEIQKMVRDRLGCEIGQGYGLTEGLVSFMQLPGAEPTGSVGRNSPNIEVKIVDVATGEALGRNQDGEILIRGPHVMKGYLNAPEATRAVLEPDGFLHSGDLGHVDDDGELFIVDRIKELIKYKGQQVSPVELEAVLMTHPLVADAAVIGVPDEESSEIPKGFVVARSSVTSEELIRYVAERVAPYKKIRRIEFIDQIPRTPVGKIERKALRARERERQAV